MVVLFWCRSIKDPAFGGKRKPHLICGLYILPFPHPMKRNLSLMGDPMIIFIKNINQRFNHRDPIEN
jgi:hypothetical protein